MRQRLIAVLTTFIALVVAEEEAEVKEVTRRT